MPLPLYGFLQGDTIVLLILAEEDDTAEVLAGRIVQAANVRVSPREASSLRIRFQGKLLDPAQTLASAGVSPLDRFDAEVCSS